MEKKFKTGSLKHILFLKAAIVSLKQFSVGHRDEKTILKEIDAVLKAIEYFERGSKVLTIKDDKLITDAGKIFCVGVDDEPLYTNLNEISSFFSFANDDREHFGKIYIEEHTEDEI